MPLAKKCIACGRDFVARRATRVFHSKMCAQKHRRSLSSDIRRNSHLPLTSGQYRSDWGPILTAAANAIWLAIEAFLNSDPRGYQQILGYQLIRFHKSGSGTKYSHYPYIPPGCRNRLDLQGKPSSEAFFSWDPFECPIVAETGSYQVRVRLPEGLELLPGVAVFLPGSDAVYASPKRIFEDARVAQPERPTPASQPAVKRKKTATAPHAPAVRGSSAERHDASNPNANKHERAMAMANLLNSDPELRDKRARDIEHTERPTTPLMPPDEPTEEDYDLALEFLDIAATSRIQQADAGNAVRMPEEANRELVPPTVPSDEDYDLAIEFLDIAATSRIQQAHPVVKTDILGESGRK